MEPHNAVIRTLRQRLTVQSATREAAQEDSDDRPASFGMTQSGQTIIFPSVATAQTAQAGPAPCAFARGMHRAEAEEAGRPGIDSGGGDFGGGCEGVVDGDEYQIDVGGGPGGECEGFEDGDECQIDVGGDLWAKCRKIERGVQLRLAMQRSLPQFKLVARTSK